MEINTFRQENKVENKISSINSSVIDNQSVSEKTSNILSNNSDSNFSDSCDRTYTEKDLQESLDIVNALLNKHNSHAEYYMHDKFKNVIMIKFIDSDTGEILQEVPPKKIIDMIAKMCEMVGIILDKKA